MDDARRQNDVVYSAISCQCHCIPIPRGGLRLAQKCVHDQRRVFEVNVSLDLSLVAQIVVGDLTQKCISVCLGSLAKGVAKPGRDLRILRYADATGLCPYPSRADRTF